jgi:hypothetical protein
VEGSKQDLPRSMPPAQLARIAWCSATLVAIWQCRQNMVKGTHKCLMTATTTVEDWDSPPVSDATLGQWLCSPTSLYTVIREGVTVTPPSGTDRAQKGPQPLLSIQSAQG